MKTNQADHAPCHKSCIQKYLYTYRRELVKLEDIDVPTPYHGSLTQGHPLIAILYSPTAFGDFTGAFDLSNSRYDISLIETRVYEWYEHTRHEGDDGVRAWILAVFEYLQSCFGSVSHMIIALTDIYIKSITYPMERMFILHDIALSNHSPESESSNLEMQSIFLLSRSERAYFLYPYDFSQYFYVVLSINNRVLFQLELPIDWKLVRRSEYGVYYYSTF